MCGRFTLTASPEEVADLFDLDALEAFPPRYNIAPTQPILVVGNAPAGGRRAILVRWGLVPGWVKDPSSFTLLINARSESAAEKPSFRNAMRHRRVLVPASGFYEWHRPADRKAPRQPYFVRPRGGGIVAFAGVMETWHSPEGSEIDTAAILTAPANAAIASIHDRMPVVIPPDQFSRWLDCLNQEPRHVADLMRPAPDDLFEAIPVSDKVNKVANTGPDIQDRITAPLTAPAPRRTKPAAKPGDGQYDLF